jgi:hypothetical protein
MALPLFLYSENRENLQVIDQRSREIALARIHLQIQSTWCLCRKAFLINGLYISVRSNPQKAYDLMIGQLSRIGFDMLC